MVATHSYGRLTRYDNCMRMDYPVRSQQAMPPLEAY